MSKLEIVITMGGLGSRFQKAGYTVPKYMIEAKGKTLFEWSLLSLADFQKDAAFTFLARAEEGLDVEGFIRKECEKLGIEAFEIILLDHLTDGQATTALLANRVWNPENALLVYNIDTYVEPFAMRAEDLRGDGFIPCFRADGDHWSFVRLDEAGRVAEIREKQRISDHCTLGAYYFKSCALYERLYRAFYQDEKNLVNGEKYIAPLYNFLLEQGGEIYISDIPSEKVHVLGTPEELQVFLEEA